MIKKLVHYAWFGGDEMPDTIKKCIASWHRFLPDYEFKKWDMSAIEGIDSVYLKEALSVKKWAFAVDFIRLYAVYNWGGIYLDTDVELKGSFDPFLKHRMFIGKERFYQLSYTYKNPGLCRYLTSHCFGAEAGHPFLKKCLDYYSGRHFILSENLEIPESIRYDHTVIPYILACIAYSEGFNWNPKAQSIQSLGNGLTIYPTEFFDGNIDQKKCVAIHHALGSWTIGYGRDSNTEKKLIVRIKKLIVNVLYHFDIAVFKLRK